MSDPKKTPKGHPIVGIDTDPNGLVIGVSWRDGAMPTATEQQMVDTIAKLRARVMELEDAVSQLRGALVLDHMVDENGNPHGTTLVALAASQKILPSGQGVTR